MSSAPRAFNCLQDSSDSDDSFERISDSEIDVNSCDESFTSCQGSDNYEIVNSVEEEIVVLKERYEKLRAEYERVCKDRDSLQEDLLRVKNVSGFFISSQTASLL